MTSCVFVIFVSSWLPWAAAAADADGTTPLHRAGYQDDLAAADALIRAGANVNAANDLGVTPLWLAARTAASRWCARLLAAGANPNAPLLAGETPVMVAARAGKAAVVEQLVAKGANVNARGARKQTALMWAVSQKHPEVVKVLLAHGADVSLRSEKWSQVMAVPPHGYLPYNRDIPAGGETALMFAARVGDLDSMQLLVAAGANVNDADAWGVSAVALAAHSGFDDVVRFLLEKGADPNAMRAGFAALHEAIMRRDETMVAALLDHGADANAPLQTWTPTRRSSDDWNFAPELVGATPFWLAARFTEPRVMATARQARRGPAVCASWRPDGRRPRRGIPASPGRHDAADGGDGHGRRSRVGAAPFEDRERAALEAAKLVVELGVDLNAANTDGRTALDGARTLKYESVIAFLKEHGGKASGKPAPSVRVPN